MTKTVLFSWDAEFAHHLTVRLIRAVNRLGRGRVLEILADVPRKSELSRALERTVWGIRFANPLGLAAGFDKDGKMIDAVSHLGFGFLEIGTVTPRPQPGNPRPRLFRNPQEGWIFNRMGFNGEGAALISARLAEFHSKKRSHDLFPVGVNLGKNKDTPNDEAAADYVKAARAFAGLADYLVVNVSSPNTPGLRNLQAKETLIPLLRELQNLVKGWQKVPPVLLKLAPELFLERNLKNDDHFGPTNELQDLILGLEGESSVQGWVVSNTLGGQHLGQPGGFSGKVLTAPARTALVKLRAISAKPIISVGGICTEEEARWRLKNGADLIQIYSGWVFNGPDFVSRILRFLP